jgi:hypothetical protein
MHQPLAYADDFNLLHKNSRFNKMKCGKEFGLEKNAKKAKYTHTHTSSPQNHNINTGNNIKSVMK